jgi:branched-chain amino acid transport system permease protein
MVDLLISQALNGFVWGWILALISIGLTLIYGQLGIVNIAHGVLYTVGAVVAYYCFAWLGGWGWSLILSPIFLALLGFVIYNTTMRSIVGKDPILTVIITYGIFFVLEHSTLLVFGGAIKTVRNPIDYSIPFLQGTYPLYRVFCAAFSVLVIVALSLFLKETRLGLWIRATKQDYETATNMGIPIRKVYVATFCLGAAMAGLGGALAAPITSVNFSMGHNIIVDAFVVVITAGFGSIPGTVIAALIIEIVIGISAAFVNPVMARVISIGVMLIALIIRPEGIFGEK